MKDKVIHFWVSFGVSFLLSLWAGGVAGFFFTAGLGIGKEVGDYMSYGKSVGNKAFAKMAVADLIADFLGIFFGVLIGSALKGE